MPYITLTNLGQILTHDPGVAAVLTLLGLLLLLFVYWQFTFLILGIQNIHPANSLKLLSISNRDFEKNPPPNTDNHRCLNRLLCFNLSIFKRCFQNKLAGQINHSRFHRRFYFCPMVSRPTGHSALHDGYLARRPLVAIITCFNFERNPSSKAVAKTWRMTRGQTWRTLLAVLLIFIPVAVLTYFADHWPIFTSVMLDSHWNIGPYLEPPSTLVCCKWLCS